MLTPPARRRYVPPPAFRQHRMWCKRWAGTRPSPSLCPPSLFPPGSPVRPSGSPRTTPSHRHPRQPPRGQPPDRKPPHGKPVSVEQQPRRAAVAHSRGKSPNGRAKRAPCRSRGGPPSRVESSRRLVLRIVADTDLLPVVGRLSNPAAPRLLRAGRASGTRCGCSSHPGCLGESSCQTGARLPDADLAATTLRGAAAPD